jgi:hypothetical protein
MKAFPLLLTMNRNSFMDQLYRNNAEMQSYNKLCGRALNYNGVRLQARVSRTSAVTLTCVESAMYCYRGASFTI